MPRTNRNAYEIRLETLCLARDILSERSHMAADRRRANAGGDTIEETEHYTADDVIKQAEKLYAFISPEDKPNPANTTAIKGAQPHIPPDMR